MSAVERLQFNLPMGSVALPVQPLPVTTEHIAGIGQSAQQDRDSVKSAFLLEKPQVSNLLLNEVQKKQLEDLLRSIKDDAIAPETLDPKLLGFVAGLLVDMSNAPKSAAAEDLYLEALLGMVVKEKSNFDKERISQVRSENIETIQKNQDKITESLKAGQEAKKSGLAAKIFGWIGAIASIVVGIVMCATGVGAAAGALMIAGGVLGVVSCAVQQAAQDGLISKEVMQVLGPVLQVVEAIVAVISIVVTFGAGAARTVAKYAAKVATKVAGTVGEFAAAVSAKASKVANFAAKVTDVTSKAAGGGMKLAALGADTVVKVGDGASKLANSIMEVKVAEKAADSEQTRAELSAGEAVIKKLVAELASNRNALQQALELILSIHKDNADSQDRIFNNIHNARGV